VICAAVICAVALTFAPVSLEAQQLLDRVLARVDATAVTLTDVRAAMGLGIIDTPPNGDLAQALQQVIARELVLLEVQRFPPPEPANAAIDAEVAAITARVGSALPALMASTGLDAIGLREAARDNLRIRAYLDQRFGSTVQASDDEVDAYYRAHPEEFLRNGVLMPFDEAEPVARLRAGAARRQASINQWMVDLRMRTNVIVTSR
jgi:hypothetical protein